MNRGKKDQVVSFSMPGHPLPDMASGELTALRKDAARRIGRLIAFLNATDGYSSTELEDETEDDDESDDEPSLGAPEAVNQSTSWTHNCGTKEDLEIDLGSPGLYSPGSQVFSVNTFGTVDGREIDDDFEPSLGSTNGNEHGSGFCTLDSSELEDEHDGREPSLGSLNWATEVVERDSDGRPTKFREGDQSCWEWGSSDKDCEGDQAEQEGGIED